MNTLLQQILPKDLVQYVIVPYLTISREEVMEQHKRVMEEFAYVFRLLQCKFCSELTGDEYNICANCHMVFKMSGCTITYFPK